MTASEAAADQLTGEALQSQIKIGKMLFAVAVAPLFIQVRDRFARGTARRSSHSTERACVHQNNERWIYCAPG